MVGVPALLLGSTSTAVPPSVGTVTYAKRRSRVLVPSSLACLSTLPTVNLTAGCLHGCVYCYARAYSGYPGDGVAVLYQDLPQRLERELSRAKSRPHAVYFSPSSDLFQPHPDIQQCAEEVLQILFRHRVGVVFLTKGAITEASMRLLEMHAGLVQAQIGLLSTDVDVASTFEPGAASPLVRLEQMKRLMAAGIQTVARVDPILPGISDGDEAFDRLFSAVRDTAVRDAAAGILYTRPGIVAGLRRAWGPMASGVPAMLSRFPGERNMGLRGAGTTVVALPEEERIQIIERAERHATEHGIRLRVCACKNADIASGTCGIAGAWRRSARPRQLALPV